jgi:cyanophycin synthetase
MKKRLIESEIKNYKQGTRTILRAAFKKNVSVYKFLDKERVFILKKGSKQVWFRGPRLSVANPVSLWIIKDKFLTKKALRDIGVPCPLGYPVKTVAEAVAIAKKIKFPVIIKPLKGEGGNAVFLNIDSVEKVKKFFRKVIQTSRQVLVEKQVFGKYYRITMVDHKVAGILETSGIRLRGDSRRSVKELICAYNESGINKCKINKKIKDILSFQNLSLRSVPPRKSSFILGFSGSEGGRWIDRTDLIAKENTVLLKKITQYLDLKVAGIDLIAKNISLPIVAVGSPGYILEINGAPEFTFHFNPSQGKPRDIGKAIVDMLFK